jgi:hypothetical protein
MSAKPPYVAAAFICEKILQEQDGVASAIRIIDRIFIEKVNAPGDERTGAAELMIFISFKGGGYTGKADVLLAPTMPSGKPMKSQQLEVQFPKEHNAGANIVVRAAIAFHEEGVHWFNVSLNGELVTRMPLDVQQMTPEMLQSLPGAASQKPK